MILSVNLSFPMMTNLILKGPQPTQLLYNRELYQDVIEASVNQALENGSTAPNVTAPPFQLSVAMASRDMEQFPEGDLHRSADDAQAVLEDYRETVDMVRGQLNPDQHQADFDDQAATYTLTNAVPLVREFHAGPWAAQEKVTRQRLNNYCRGTAYVVTGALTSGRVVRHFDAERVAVPDYVWSAYCCDDYDCNAPYPEFSRFPGLAALGPNRGLDNEVREMSVQQLEDFIKRVTGKTVNIFEDCKL